MPRNQESAPKRGNARNRTWDALSPEYRKRLERGGLNKRRYESGESLKAARGHAATPERPRDAHKSPDKFPEYRQRKITREKNTSERADLIRYAKNNAVQVLGDSHYFNSPKITRHLNSMTNDELREAATISGEEWKSRAARKSKFNPWWYR